MVTRGDARREQIPCAAIVVFADHGYDRASLAGIAEHVGISRAGLAREVVAVMDGLQLQWLPRPEEVDMVAGFRDCAARLIRSVAVDPEPVVALPAAAVPVPLAAHAG